MARAQFIPPLPSNDRSLAVWSQLVADRLNSIPDHSIISTSDGPESAATYFGGPGALRTDIGSSVTRLWVKDSSSLTALGWSAYSHI